MAAFSLNSLMHCKGLELGFDHVPKACPYGDGLLKYQ